ncbi:uncharacterized protein N7529_005419 [Penicillium soppii]|uniref:uncharacterized protein n=1 Tax=Penicillium soppii TaxID=69789 RepID=UPI00254714A0|nr:uncharacterized protein N7529_005419 [Penicillium soppii]KAJ5873066.1 hypothetical protein N7529_005419 [Penicillium soppii]
MAATKASTSRSARSLHLHIIAPSPYGWMVLISDWTWPSPMSTKKRSWWSSDEFGKYRASAFEWPWGWVKTEGLRVARLEDSTLFKKSLPVDLQLIIND